ncbi:PREDICTED: uncharacterized protein LOC109116097 [Tarenaya hassleriana]|uniref:uncharacterized protein LOC109116097 n=1 Tax=Tarenaya hassleriana TaxID=28532 RepID=UPI0008FD0D05|nr:PREDICTED: uncharacterized protein LOC109116097 [Tarenaya hassleriana]
MAPRLRSSSAPPSPSILGPHPSLPPPSDLIPTPTPPEPTIASPPPPPPLSSTGWPSLQLGNRSTSCPPSNSVPRSVLVKSGSSTGVEFADAKVDSNPQISSPAEPLAGVIGPDSRKPGSLVQQQTSTTWSKKLFAPPRRLKRMGTPGVHVSGAPLITIPEEAIKESTEEWSEFLIGQFYGLPPTMGRIIGIVNALWTRGGPRIRVQNVGNGTYLFKVTNAAARAYILARQFWYVGQCPMYVTAWNPYHNPERPPMRSVNTWVSFRNVPQTLYNTDCLSRIATSIGEPLYMDRQTEAKENVSLARIYVEVSLQNPLPRRIVVNLPCGTEKSIDASYDWLPPQCKSCSEVGHNASHCPKIPGVTRPRRVEPSKNAVPLEDQTPTDLKQHQDLTHITDPKELITNCAKGQGMQPPTSPSAQQEVMDSNLQSCQDPAIELPLAQPQSPINAQISSPTKPIDDRPMVKSKDNEQRALRKPTSLGKTKGETSSNQVQTKGRGRRAMRGN